VAGHGPTGRLSRVCPSPPRPPPFGSRHDTLICWPGCAVNDQTQLLIIHSQSQHLHDTLCYKKLSCRREAARCFVFACSQLQHTYSAVFLLLVTAASDLLVHKIILNYVLLSPIVSGGIRPNPPPVQTPLGHNPLVCCRSCIGWVRYGIVGFNVPLDTI